MLPSFHYLLESKYPLKHQGYNVHYFSWLSVLSGSKDFVMYAREVRGYVEPKYGMSTLPQLGFEEFLCQRMANHCIEQGDFPAIFDNFRDFYAILSDMNTEEWKRFESYCRQCIREYIHDDHYLFSPSGLMGALLTTVVVNHVGGDWVKSIANFFVSGFDDGGLATTFFNCSLACLAAVYLKKYQVESAYLGRQQRASYLLTFKPNPQHENNRKNERGYNKLTSLTV